MNDFTKPFAALDSSVSDSTNRSADSVYPDIFLPTKIYEALPAAYISIGTLFIAGAAYIGIGHGLVAGYLGVGVSCILAGVTVNGVRRKKRST